jgi:hypothetical protein
MYVCKTNIGGLQFGGNEGTLLQLPKFQAIGYKLVDILSLGDRRMISRTGSKKVNILQYRSSHRKIADLAPIYSALLTTCSLQANAPT